MRTFEILCVLRLTDTSDGEWHDDRRVQFDLCTTNKRLDVLFS